MAKEFIKYKSEKNELIILISFLLILFIASSASAYERQVPSVTQQSGSFFGSFGTTPEQQCQSAGQDFVIQVAPFGCTHAVVGDDLLKNQDVPVFCQLVATKINPLIDISAINNIVPQSPWPENIRDIGYFPSKAAIGRSPQALNSPIFNNIGYAVIVLKQQKNQSAMPDFVQGNVTARLSYNIKNAFGIGKASFYLPEINDNEWDDRKAAYSFWNGKGLLRADSVYEDHATIGVYSGDRRISTVDLKQGETSPKVYLPGFDCVAGLQLHLDSLEYPSERARLNINGDIEEVKRGDSFLGGACTLQSIDKKGVLEKVTITCSSTSPFSLSYSPKIKLEIQGAEPKGYNVGDKLFTDGNKCVYLGYAGTSENSGKEKDLYARFIETPDCPYNLSDYQIAEVARYDKDNLFVDVATVPERFFTYLAKGSEITGRVTSVGHDIYGKMIFVSGFGDAFDADLNSEVGKVYNNAKNDFETVLSSYAETKYPQDNQATKGEEAYVKEIELASNWSQEKTVSDLCKQFKEKYPTSSMLWGVQSLCDVKTTSSSAIVSNYVSINGVQKEILFEGVFAPSLEEYSVELTIKGNDSNYTGKRILRYNGETYLSDSEPIILTNLAKGYAEFDVSKVKQELSLAQKALDITIRVNLNQEYSLGKDKAYSIRVDKINLRKIVKVSVVDPSLSIPTSVANFSFKIGIEKSGIKLSPSEIKNKIDLLNSTISEWQDKNDKLGNIVQGMKTACLATDAVLTVKNFLNNKDGKAIARKEVMRGEKGWYSICENLVKENKAQYPSVEKCLVSKSKEIDADVDSVYQKIKSKNSDIDTLQKQFEKTGFLGEKVVDDNGFCKAYLDSRKGDITSQIKAKFGGDNIEVQGGKKINVDAFINKLDCKTTSIDDIRELDLYSSISGSSGLNDMVKARLTTKAKDVYDTNVFLEERTTASDLYGIKVDVGASDKIKDIPITEDYKFSQIKDKFNIQGPVFKYPNIADSDFVRLYKDRSTAKNYLLKLDNNKEDVQETYIINNGQLILQDSPNPLGLHFQKYDHSTYQNQYISSLGEGKVVARYFENDPYKGMPALVPFDLANGWYVSAAQTLPGIGKIQAYDQSGRPRSVYICNVGKDGIEQNRQGDDICELINTGTGMPYNVFPGLSDSEAASLIKRAIGDRGALEQATKQYGKSTIVIFNWKIYVGSPAVDIPDIQCQDFMSPSDCQILFNVCDPVICPSSRCDLGGAYHVRDVIQSGIVGSIALCLPNYQEGIYVPICLSGVNAGIDALLSVQKSFRDCLQNSLDTGQTMGICEEIYSLHSCEFFWRQGIPLIKYGTPKLLETLAGQNVRGGGEYAGVESAWQNAGQSVKYFTNYYAQNSFKAFKARSTEEVGGEICKQFVSASYPSSATILDSLTKPDSPSQFYGRFDEIPFTTATSPPTSQYSVLYHIYAGKDQGVYYRVYFKGDSTSSFYQDTANTLLIPRASGYIAAGGYASDSVDFTAPSGYKELCIMVNNQVQCGFQQVTTDFSVNYMAGKYAAQQTSKSDIKTTSECVSGSPSLYSLLNPSIEAGATNVVNPALYNAGITRICAGACPSQNTNGCVGENSEWIKVGYCDDPKMGCWLNRQNVKDIIKNANIEAGALKQQNDATQKALQDGVNYIPDDNSFDAEAANVQSLAGPQEKINNLTEMLTRAYWNRHRGQIYFLRGIEYGNLAHKVYIEVNKPNPSDLKPALPRVPGLETGDLEEMFSTLSSLSCVGLDKYNDEQKKQIIENLRFPEYSINYGSGILDQIGNFFGSSTIIYFTYYGGGWKWTFDDTLPFADVANTVYNVPGPIQSSTKYDGKAFPENYKFIADNLKGKNYDAGASYLIETALKYQKKLYTKEVVLGTDKILFLPNKQATWFFNQDNKWIVNVGAFDITVDIAEKLYSDSERLPLADDLKNSKFTDGAKTIFICSNVYDKVKESEDKIAEVAGYTSCSDCGKGITNICEKKECDAISAKTGLNCIYEDTVGLGGTCVDSNAKIEPPTIDSFQCLDYKEGETKFYCQPGLFFISFVDGEWKASGNEKVWLNYTNLKFLVSDLGEARFSNLQGWDGKTARNILFFLQGKNLDEGNKIIKEKGVEFKEQRPNSEILDDINNAVFKHELASDCTKYYDGVLGVSDDYNIDPLLLFALMQTESSCNSQASSESTKLPFENGASYGLMQISGKTWCGKYGLPSDPNLCKDQLLNSPLTNIKIGALILKDYYTTDSKTYSCSAFKSTDSNGKIIQDEPAVNKAYTGWEYALRSYNGWSCARIVNKGTDKEKEIFADQDYVGKIMDLYRKLVALNLNY
ncbi:transglycosylase SLT domain-containing protein [Candidatus Pacearchaeota archaeon]|nr:transglycosylase SLT domain-containing protein [Candidatus Pacearchaeota archaeon]